MPELPEVEVLRRSLEPLLPGDVVERVEVSGNDLREPIDARALTRDLAGRKIERLRRRAKYLIVDLAGGSSLVVHLGMSGRLTLADPARHAREPHTHLVVHLVSGRELRLRDPRRFGVAFTAATATLPSDPHFAHLGVEPLAGAFSGTTLRGVAAGRRGPIKPFLMDARVVVGIGNIYACEALWEAGIHPRRSVGRVAATRWERLATACREVLARAISQGGTTLNDFADGEGNSGYFQVSLAVYDREGDPCRRCATPIRRTVQGGRSTFYCPGCQT